ncbi:uncharacterized protein PSFLO_07194 [Pseudozyma flocculosa]|uniref:Uncharacterized protein n=1 Tax=Pseudozyma flocculosa TaxID=84751 RepID=A0A5C3FBF9_9BASI|nr:uncharacterized protein PSFLO_07194 [Pseudozyma flocculosa]
MDLHPAATTDDFATFTEGLDNIVSLPRLSDVEHSRHADIFVPEAATHESHGRITDTDQRPAAAFLVDLDNPSSSPSVIVTSLPRSYRRTYLEPHQADGAGQVDADNLSQYRPRRVRSGREKPRFVPRPDVWRYGNEAMYELVHRELLARLHHYLAPSSRTASIGTVLRFDHAPASPPNGNFHKRVVDSVSRPRFGRTMPWLLQDIPLDGYTVVFIHDRIRSRAYERADRSDVLAYRAVALPTGGTGGLKYLLGEVVVPWDLTALDKPEGLISLTGRQPLPVLDEDRAY